VRSAPFGLFRSIWLILLWPVTAETYARFNAMDFNDLVARRITAAVRGSALAYRTAARNGRLAHEHAYSATAASSARVSITSTAA
jgi:hypothetical protein